MAGPEVTVVTPVMTTVMTPVMTTVMAVTPWNLRKWVKDTRASECARSTFSSHPSRGALG